MSTNNKHNRPETSSSSRQEGDGNPTDQPHKSSNRSRPPKNVRDSDSTWAKSYLADEAAEAREAKKTGPKKEKKNKGKKSEIPEFTPGKYPVIFDTTTASIPVVDIPTVYDASDIYVQALDAYQAMEYDAQFSEYMETISFAATAPADAPLRSIIATSGLCASQNIVHTCKEHHRDFGGLTYVTRTEITAPETLQMVASQYGFFLHEDTRENYIPTAVGEQHARFVRLAHQIDSLPPPITRPDVVAIVRGCGWLPAHADDTSVDIVLRHHLQQWANNQGLAWLDVKSQVLWAQPPWWASITAAQQAQIDWFMNQGRPNTQAAWLTRLNAIPAGWYGNSGMLDPFDAAGAARQYQAADLDFANWQANARTRFTNIMQRYQSVLQMLPQFLNCAVSKTARSDTGSTAPLGLMQYTAPTVLYKSVTSVMMTEANLFVAFPLMLYQTEGQHRRSAVISASRDLSYERTAWLQAGIKGRKPPPR